MTEPRRLAIPTDDHAEPIARIIAAVLGSGRDYQNPIRIADEAVRLYLGYFDPDGWRERPSPIHGEKP